MIQIRQLRAQVKKTRKALQPDQQMHKGLQEVVHLIHMLVEYIADKQEKKKWEETMEIR